MHGTIGGPVYKPRPATVAHDPRKAPIAVKGVKVTKAPTSNTKGKGK
jgi:hypothetical protein